MGIIQRKIVKSDNDGYVRHDVPDIFADNVTLLIGYDGYDNLSSICDLWVYFENLPIPFGSVIVSAELQLNAYAVYETGLSTKFYASLDNDNVTSYTQFSNLTPTENFQEIYLDEQVDGQIFSVDLKNVVQEKVNNKAWTYGSNLLLFTKDTIKEFGPSYVDIDSYEWEINQLLTIEFVPAEIITLKQALIGNRFEYFEYQHYKLLNNKLSEQSKNIANNILSSDITINFENLIKGNIKVITNDDSNLGFNDIIRPFYCIDYKGKTYKLAMGSYFLKSPVKKYENVMFQNTIMGQDMTIALEEDKLVNSLTIPSGTVVTTYVKSLIAGVGSWLTYNIQESTETLNDALSYVTGKSKLFVINSLLNTINYYPVWSDGTGIIRSIPWTANPNITWNFKDDSNSLYIGKFNIENDGVNIFNRAVVVANQLTPDTEPITATYDFEDIGLTNHPLSYTNLGRRITKIFQSEATSQSYVNLRAERELLKAIEIEESIDYKHAIVSSRDTDGLPWFGDCFNFYHSDYSSDLNSVIYKIISHTFSLKVGSLVSSKIRKSKYYK